MRETVIDGERFFVFQDVCRELGCRKLFSLVSRENKTAVMIPQMRPAPTVFNVVNAAGVEEMREAISREATKPRRKSKP